MKARRFSRICSRPFHCATPSRHVASSTKQSKPLPKVLSSISFQKANSHSGASHFVKVVMLFSWAAAQQHLLRSGQIDLVQALEQSGADLHVSVGRDHGTPPAPDFWDGQDQPTRASLGINAK